MFRVLTPTSDIGVFAPRLAVNDRRDRLLEGKEASVYRHGQETFVRWSRSILSFAIAASCVWCVGVVQQVHHHEQSTGSNTVDATEVRPADAAVPTHPGKIEPARAERASDKYSRLSGPVGIKRMQRETTRLLSGRKAHYISPARDTNLPKLDFGNDSLKPGSRVIRVSLFYGIQNAGSGFRVPGFGVRGRRGAGRDLRLVAAVGG